MTELNNNSRDNDKKQMMMKVDKNKTNMENMSQKEVVNILALNMKELTRVSTENAGRIAILEQENSKNKWEIKKLNEYNEANARIEAYQDEIIKDRVRNNAKRILGDDYDNKSKKGIIFGWSYSKLGGYGYGSKGSTKQKMYKQVLEAIDNGIIDFTKESIDKRYKKIQENNENDKRSK